ncbi:CDF family Co(II)/Ni(II) efflux transporter DmeF [Desulfoprunum benzoelyticum]|uniref:Cation diffusion facilitator family transporter n=1 Tax=Desulfoprunum benzoelyticum TaxID=1506996 RepID=A0A840UUI5_9BACT|nr:CDF family Co(II)/Ni(II) efflux transporter DmeF [Desulfoprunum benzoelyticum]MBB5348496.1 cation diffusion facilitator family transporter [Desulfoprunum benzoelyticum]MBM9530169.1 CDF family Co(II)/Ni(II) efflux transporter DmeF [Desulfoprunum benzoelyticum]
MHSQTIEQWQHRHDFSTVSRHGEKKTRLVLYLTAVTMAVEIAAGLAFGSMALLADGWHMATHTAAFLITIFAYRYAARNAGNPSFAFGTGKVSVLGGFASAIALASVALMMMAESLQRMAMPEPIRFNEAIAVACLGLAVNIVSAFLLQDHHHHDDHHHDGAGHDHHHHHDHNLRAAYLHVMADALTSVLAIVALLFGKFLGWQWLDPLMGIVGALVISRWSLSLLRQTGPILLDSGIDGEFLTTIRAAIERDRDNRVSDIHIWRVGPADYAAIIAIVTHAPLPTDHYKGLLQQFAELSHVSIEIHACDGEPCLPIPTPGS